MAENGVDSYNLRRVPWTIDHAKMPHEVRDFVRAAEVAENRKNDWEKSRNSYPELIMTRRITNVTILAVAVPLSMIWFVGWLVAIGVGLTLGWSWVFVAWLLLSAAVGSGLVFVNAFRFRNQVKPLEKAVDETGVQLMIFQFLLFAFPIIFPWAGWHALDAFIAQPDLKPTGDDAEAIRIARDTRAKVAVAMSAGIRTLNLLAYQLKHEMDMRKMHGEPKEGETALDINRTERLLYDIRETVLRQQEFLQSTHDDAPLGEFHSDVTALVMANADKIAEATGILADSRERGAMVIELAAALAGQKGAMMVRKEKS